MHNPALNDLGQTRSSQHRNHLLLTPDTFVRTPLPGMKKCMAVVHAGTTLGAAFTQYTAEFELGGELGDTTAQRFLYVIDGEIHLEVGGKKTQLKSRGYAYIPRKHIASRGLCFREPRSGHRKTLQGYRRSRSATRHCLQRRQPSLHMRSTMIPISK